MKVDIGGDRHSTLFCIGIQLAVWLADVGVSALFDTEIHFDYQVVKEAFLHAVSKILSQVANYFRY